MSCCAQHQIAVDLVGAQDQVAFDAELGEGADLVRCPRGAAGIVRIAEKHDLRARSQLRAQRVEVHQVAAVGLDELCVEDAPVVCRDDLAEGVIGWRKEHDLVTGLGDRLQDEAEPRDYARRRGDPSGIERQLMATQQPLAERFGPAPGIGVVAVDTAIHHLPQRLGDAGRRRKIHVRDPHRDGVGRGDARQFRHVVPLRCMRAAALDDTVEVEHGTAIPW